MGGELKLCNVCNEMKPIDDFWKNSAAPDGYRNQCRECREGVTVVVGGARGGGKTLAAKNELSYLVSNLSNPPGGAPLPPGGFGTEFILTIPSFDYTMQDVDMCPVCNDYDVRFNCMLEDGNIKIPFLCCNDCLQKAGTGLIKFYKQDEIVYVVRSIKVDSL